MAELTFRLSGPMAGFGEPGSTRSFRPCAIIPNKQSLVGLLSAALGYKKNDERIQELYDSVETNVELEKIGERFVDWQTVHHEKVYEYQTNGKLKPYNMQTADGRTYDGPCIRKEYISDVSYIVTIYGEQILVDELKEALTLPVWPIYLGRKCCIADPIEFL